MQKPNALLLQGNRVLSRLNILYYTNIKFIVLSFCVLLFFHIIIVTADFFLTLKLVFLCFGVYTANCSQLRIISMLSILTYTVKRGCKSKMHILLVDTLWDPVVLSFFLRLYISLCILNLPPINFVQSLLLVNDTCFTNVCFNVIGLY